MAAADQHGDALRPGLIASRGGEPGLADAGLTGDGQSAASTGYHPLDGGSQRFKGTRPPDQRNRPDQRFSGLALLR